MDIIRIGSTNTTTLKGLFDRVDLQYEEGATVTASFFDPSGAEITDAQNITMAQVSGTSGKSTVYRAGHAADLFEDVAEGEGSRLIVATDTDGNVRRFVDPVRFEN